MLKPVLFLLFLLFCFACKNETPLFVELGSKETNIDFRNDMHESEDFNVLKYGYFYNGGGVAAADFNNDGWVDLYFTGNLKPNKLYLNQGHNLNFRDITKEAGVAAEQGWNTGVTVVDINADGWLDLYVCRSAAQNPFLRKNLLFVNNGIKKGENYITFTENAAQYGLDNKGYSNQAVFFDYDKDGDLDAYIVNHSVQGYAGFSRLLANNKNTYDPELGSKLLRNDSGFFNDVTLQAGIISNVLGFGLGIAVSDLNNDGWLDMYISNDYNEEDYLYINQQDGTFKESIKEQIGHVSLFSMGNDAADLNNDGAVDIVTLDMLPESNKRIKMTSGDDNYDKYQMLIQSGFHHQNMRNMLQLNNGNGTFSEIGQLAGISNTDWSWAALCADYDLDGFKDIFITNGYAKDYTNMDFLKYSMYIQTENQNRGRPINQLEVIKKIPSIQEANYIYRNNGNLTFEKKQLEWGLSNPLMSNGAVYADLDNDGDLDLVINTINDESKIFKNTQRERQKAHFLKIDLHTTNPSLLIGTKVSIFIKGQRQLQEFSPTRGFQSSSYTPLVFGVGSTVQADSIEVIWADGKREVLKHKNTNQTLTFSYNRQLTALPRKKSIPQPSNYQVNIINKPSFLGNDFKIQPLLPKMQSVYGSRMAIGDVNNDNKMDLYICGNQQNPSQLLINQNKNWVPATLQFPEKYQDVDAVFVDIDNDSDLDLVVVSGNYAAEPQSSLLRPRVYFNQGKGAWSEPIFINYPINASSITFFDFNKDKKMDLFIGGASHPRCYPRSEPSLLLINQGQGKFVKQEFPLLNKLGIVRDIQAVDFDKDGWLDILTAGEFQPIRWLKNDKGKTFVVNEIAPTGLWNRIKAADLDSDGTIELIAGNEGLNSQLVKLTDSNGLRLVAGEFGSGTQILPIMAFSQQSTWYPFASRDEMLDQQPIFKSRYTDYLSFSKATLNDLIDASKIQFDWQAKEFHTVVIRQKNGHYQLEKLPIQAQFSPIYTIEVFDYDHDGLSDIVLAGNESHTRVRVGKADANYIQIFKGNKNKAYTYLPNSQTNIWTKGDLSDLKVIDNKFFVLKH